MNKREKKKTEAKISGHEKERDDDGDTVMKDTAAGPAAALIFGANGSKNLFESQYRVKEINPKGKKQFYVQTLVLDPISSTSPQLVMDVCKRYKDQTYCDVNVNQVLKVTLSKQPPAPKSGYRMPGVLFKKATVSPGKDKDKTGEISHLFFSCSGLIADLSFPSLSCSNDPFVLHETYWFCIAAMAK